MPKQVNFFWFRRDLRLDDNAGLVQALRSEFPVQCLFIFDKNILEKLDDKNDRRVTFIHLQLERLNDELAKHGSTLMVKFGYPTDVWKELASAISIGTVFTNHDYEPYALHRDKEIEKILAGKNIAFHSCKDQVIFEKNEIIKTDGSPYTVYTPYMKKWRSVVTEDAFSSHKTEKYFSNFSKSAFAPIPAIESIGFRKALLEFPSPQPSLNIIKNYETKRDIPSEEGTTRMSVHLRFGTVSIRRLMKSGWNLSEKWINELIWREFYMMILWHFPHVTDHAFRKQYDALPWNADEKNFQLWCEGKTGYPIVDAGMRQLNETGFMHNRLRMITAMFLTKYLLIDWRIGEAYFAKKLLDYELASNNGGWQWSAGTGVDAAPYFRIFNMDEQARRFDPDNKYIKRWVPEFGTPGYPLRMIDYTYARKRCLEFYKNYVISA